jgi:phosphoribosylanthranilate isomerase
MSVRVKICGITSIEDALVAVESGADALGFMLFDGSPRNIKPEGVRRIIRRLPPFVTRVGVFVNASETLVRQAIEAGIDTLQFHGDESPEFCVSFGLPAYKAFGIRDSSSLQDLRRYETSAWLLDTFVAGQPGGTGQTFNWEVAVQAKQFGRPIILAGGLTPENVGEAICTVAPYGVDVSSGVESTPGRKDHDKLRRFIENARAATR